MKIPGKIVNSTISHIAELIYPPVCAACDCQISHSNDVLCLQCWQQLRDAIQTPSCPACGKPTSQYEIYDGKCHFCQNLDTKLDFVIRVGDYKNTLKTLVLSLKYHQQSRLDRFLGKLAADSALARPIFRNTDYLVPIPLHWRRKLSRGYNQSEILTIQISHFLKVSGVNIPTRFDLVRTRNTPPQTTLPAGKRKTNLRGAFSIRPDAPFKGKNVCLVDDVTTTGTTLNTAAAELIKFGANSVSAIVIIVPENIC